MSRLSDRNFHGIPMKPYDMVREGLIVLVAMTALIAALAATWGFPRIPPLTLKEVATKAPVAFVTRTLSYFDGQSGLQTYGPPFTADKANAQAVLGICPACWTDVTHPLNAQVDMVMQPLAQDAVVNPAVATGLAAWKAATPAEQAAWVRAYSAALSRATAQDGSVAIPPGAYGPVPDLMDAMLKMAQSGLLEAALVQDTNPAYAPYNTDYTRAMFYMGGIIYDTVAGHFGEQGGQWGMSHVAGPYPGAWWLWPYTFLYQIPAIGNAPAADLIAGLMIAAFSLVLIFLPFIPGLNRLHLVVPVYRLIWRDWYARYPGGAASRPREQGKPAPHSGTA